MESRERGLVVRESDPFNAGTPAVALGASVVPNDLFYVRNHFPVPDLDPGEWRLVVEGAVGRELSLSLDDVRGLGPVTFASTIECAGNGRSSMEPVPAGTPWGFDAVSTARFTGVPLVRVLDLARIAPGVVEVVFEGADRGEVAPGRSEPYARGLPLDVARDPETILAWAMNGEPLSPDHGRPLRLVVPGWYGMASVKWLVRIRASREPFRGWFQAERYVYVGDPRAADGEPVRRMRVRSAIASPVEGAAVAAGVVPVAGTAWSGKGAIVGVEVSVDGGTTWGEAELGEPAGPRAAVPWTFVWRPATAGRHVLAARATDESGETQPTESIWNELGYGNNVVQRVAVTVV